MAMHFAAPENVSLSEDSYVLTLVIPELGRCTHTCSFCVLGQEGKKGNTHLHLPGCNVAYTSIVANTIDVFLESGRDITAIGIQGELPSKFDTWNKKTFPMLKYSMEQFGVTASVIDTGHDLAACLPTMLSLGEDFTYYISIGGNRWFHDHTRPMRDGSSSYNQAMWNLEQAVETDLNIRISCMLMKGKIAPIIDFMQHGMTPRMKKRCKVVVHAHLNLGRDGSLGAPSSTTEQFIEDLHKLLAAAEQADVELVIDQVLSPLNLEKTGLQGALMKKVEDGRILRIDRESRLRIGRDILTRGTEKDVLNSFAVSTSDRIAKDILCRVEAHEAAVATTLAA